MFRSIMAVAVGYLVMAILVLCATAGTFAALGPDGVFEPGTYDASKTVIVVSIVAAVIASLAGGLAAGAIARTKTPVKVLIALVVVGGIINAGYQMRKPGGQPRPADQTWMQAADGVRKDGRTEPWLAMAHAAIAGIGLRVGAAKRFRG